MAPHLRLFHEPEVTDGEDSAPGKVCVRLGDLLPLLTMAQRFKYTWLKDFRDDEVSISEDLYQVLQEFLGYRPSA
jgi:hypothetical protein